MPAADGDRIYAVRYEPTEIPGSKTMVVVVITEITGHAQTRVDSRRFAAIVESSDDAIISKDLDGVVTSWNEGAKRIFGYSADEMIGTSIMRLIPADRRAEEQSILERIRRSERVRHFETLRQTKSGRLICVSVAAAPIKDTAGKGLGASTVAPDITEQNRAPQERRVQQTRWMTDDHLPRAGVLAVPA